MIVSEPWAIASDAEKENIAPAPKIAEASQNVGDALVVMGLWGVNRDCESKAYVHITQKL